MMNTTPVMTAIFRAEFISCLTYCTNRAALKSSFAAVFADVEAEAAGLNPLAISHTARTISCRAIGRFITAWTVDQGAITWNITSRLPTMVKEHPTRPQPASQRGTSLV